ncbi:MAG: hypothetical protein R2940_15215 [Syntrophotaleaceae bacterium]
MIGIHLRMFFQAGLRSEFHSAGGTFDQRVCRCMVLTGFHVLLSQGHRGEFNPAGRAFDQNLGFLGLNRCHRVCIEPKDEKSRDQ